MCSDPTLPSDCQTSCGVYNHHHHAFVLGPRRAGCATTYPHWLDITICDDSDMPFMKLFFNKVGVVEASMKSFMNARHTSVQVRIMSRH